MADNIDELMCIFCNKNFSSKTTLYTHKTTAKYCLKIQNVKKDNENKCQYCEKVFTSKQTVIIHLKSCRKKEN